MAGKTAVVQLTCPMCATVHDQDGRVIKAGKSQSAPVELKNELADLRRELRGARDENKALKAKVDALAAEPAVVDDEKSVFD